MYSPSGDVLCQCTLLVFVITSCIDRVACALMLYRRPAWFYVDELCNLVDFICRVLCFLSYYLLYHFLVSVGIWLGCLYWCGVLSACVVRNGHIF
jgi:hypothetical protein